MNNYNHKQYIEWLQGELQKQEKVDDKLLVESKLSDYWKKRAARRAKDAKRKWPNSRDRKWALEEQEKSTKINEKIHDLFQKELEESEQAVDDIAEVMRKIKKERERLKMQREAAKKQTLDHPAEATKKRAKGKSLSVPTSPVHGGVKKGVDVKRKKSKTPVIAGTGGYGPADAAPMEEAKENKNENN